MDETVTFSPWAAIAVVLGAALILFLPRRLAAIPLLCSVGLMPFTQQVEILGSHWPLVRFLLLAGMVRIAIRQEGFKWCSIDTVMVLWSLVTIVLGSLSDGPKSFGYLFQNRMGDVYNVLVTYIVVRTTTRSFEDVLSAIKALALVAIPIAILALIERSSGENPFSVLGVPIEVDLRDDKVRCQGALAQCILFGTYGAVSTVLGMVLWRVRKRWLWFIGTASGLIITVCANSSGALIALGGGILGVILWRVRKRLRIIRWSAIGIILVLACVMKQPVWYLFARASSVFGGGGWHRANLVTLAIDHFNEWALFGTTRTVHWNGIPIAASPDNMDITNHFIIEGVKGGLLKLVLFVLLIVLAYRHINLVLRSLPRTAPASFLVWMLGVTMFSYCLAFSSVALYDQSIIIFYWLLAAIASLPIKKYDRRRQELFPTDPRINGRRTTYQVQAQIRKDWAPQNGGTPDRGNQEAQQT
jgi:hypothetical protein